jgi:hypothetical protein
MVHPVGFRGYGFQAAEGSEGSVPEGGGGAGLASIPISPQGDLLFGGREQQSEIRERASSIDHEAGRSGCALILWAWRL